MTLDGKTLLITGGARRIGRHLSLACARAGANIILHHSNSPAEAEQTATEIEQMGRRAWILQADFQYPESAEAMVQQANQLSSLYAIINNAAIFEPLNVTQTSLADWQRHLNINLTAPFLLSRDFAAQLPADQPGRIVNILDWRALRPLADHFPYIISKAALVALTQSLAVSLAPRITVNGLALGAILQPADGTNTRHILSETPAGRWADLEEVSQALLFLLTGPSYITGDVLYVDGGRHLV